MSLSASFEKKTYQFKRPSGTSRGILTEKHAWIIQITDLENPNDIGVGECSIIPGLSPDFQSLEAYEAKVTEVVKQVSFYAENRELLRPFPSIYFGLEMALLDLKNKGKALFFENDFTKGKKEIPINGLVWMGDFDFMQEQIFEKIQAGFTCIKLKIGAIHFEKELELLAQIRTKYDKDIITIRVDANGAFSPDEALSKLNLLSELDIHSIEQPIKQGQWTEMKSLCARTPLPIALDEELIGVHDMSRKKELLDTIQPQYIILKPSLVGGFKGTHEWIELATDLNIPWWITSALESNIGLNAIAQFTAEFDNDLPQGLGTGALYTNNEPSQLFIENGYLRYRLD